MKRDNGTITEVEGRRGVEKVERMRGLRVVAPAVVVVVVVALWVMRARTVALAIALLAVTAGLASLAIHVRRLTEQAAKLTEEVPDAVRMQKRALSRCQYLEAIDPAMAEKALSQFEQNEDRLKKFKTVLAAKFEIGELTYQRYLSAAEQLHQAIFDSLTDITTMLNNLDSLMVRNARNELRALEQLSQPSADESRLMNGLRERLEIAATTEAEIRSRLSFNEGALTELDRVNLALSNIKTSKSAAPIDLETAMSELRELAERAKKYSL